MVYVVILTHSTFPIQLQKVIRSNENQSKELYKYVTTLARKSGMYCAASHQEWYLSYCNFLTFTSTFPTRLTVHIQYTQQKQSSIHLQK